MQRKALRLLFSLVLAATAFSAPAPAASIKKRDPTDNFIVNGQFAEFGRFNYVALVNPAGCTGALISLDTVVTAAHCFVNGNTADFTDANVAFGYDRGPAGLSPPFAYEAASIHPLYNGSTNLYDIALLRIANPNGTVFGGLGAQSQPVPPVGALATAPRQAKDVGETVEAIGWGAITPNASEHTLRLRDVNLTVADYGSPPCNPPDEEALNAGVSFCALGNILLASEAASVPDPYVGFRRDTCPGDSGGPVILPGTSAASDTLVGLTSYSIQPTNETYACGDPYYGGVYTDVGAAPIVAYIAATEAMFNGNGNPNVSVVSLTASNAIELSSPLGPPASNTGSHGILFAINVTIATSFDMQPFGNDTVYPSLALQQDAINGYVHGIVPFTVTGFNVNTFTYTLSVSNYIINSPYADWATGRLIASLSILFRPATAINAGYAITVGKISSAQLSAAACRADATSIVGQVLHRSCVF